MLWQYIKDRDQAGEPIITSNIELNISEVYRRQQFKQLTDEEKLKCYENGIYYISRNKKTFGYYSVFAFAN